MGVGGLPKFITVNVVSYFFLTFPVIMKYGRSRTGKVKLPCKVMLSNPMYVELNLCVGRWHFIDRQEKKHARVTKYHERTRRTFTSPSLILQHDIFLIINHVKLCKTLVSTSERTLQ